jgi:hypothetical protein
MMRMIGAVLLMTLGGPALAAKPDAPPAPPPAVVQGLLACRGLADPAQRLACLDKGVADLAGAVERRDVLVADKEDVKKAKRSLFGLTLPNFNLFGQTKDDEGEKSDDRGALTEIQAVIKSARAGKSGNWLMVLDDDTRWLQTDGEPLRHDPKAGMTIRIRRAAIGSFLANIDGQRAVRVKRIQD